MIRERIKQEIKEQGNRLMLKEDIPIEHKVVSVSKKHKEVTIRIKSGKEIVVPIKKY